MKKNSQFLVLGILLIAIIVINSFSSIVAFITDYKWFQEVGYTGTFLTKLKSEFLIGIPMFIILFFVINFYLKSLKKKFGHETEIVELKKTKDKNINRLIGLGSLAISFFYTISITSTLWFEILQFLDAESFNVADPIFNHDLSFYVFKLPLINTVVSSIIGILMLLVVITIIFYIILTINRKFSDFKSTENGQFNFNQSIDLSKLYDKQSFTQIINQVAILGLFILVFIGIRIYLNSYDLLYSARGRVFGAGFTDVLVTLNMYRVMSVLCIIAAFTFYFGARKKSIRRALTFPAIVIVISIIGTVAAGVVERFIVEPDQLNKESKYIANNIEFTQLAYGLNDVKEIEFEVNNNITKEQLENNKDLLSNIRVNDQRPIQQVYNKLQGIRPYYTFSDVDIDRYMIDGEYTQVFISPREFDLTLLNEQAKTWVNQYLKYTHGYGVVVSPVNVVTSEGQPDMIVKNIPPTTTTDLNITRPEIYFGEKTNDYIIVNSDEKEFDYPSGSDNKETIYEGDAGIQLNFMNKLLFAIREGNLKFLISTNINSDSRIVINRNIMQRVNEIAPFIAYDNNAYTVINQDDGKIYWIIEGFTVSDRFPYSQPIGGDSNINYLRNSVKVVIDAYNGDTNYYISDETDPIIKTYAKIFPDLLKPISEMPQGIRDHIRYSQKYFNIQAEMYRTYHMENTTVFFGREDNWDIAKEKYMDAEQTANSNYMMFKLPDEKNLEFLLTIPYTPQGKDNMSGLLVARNDGENYGELLLYTFPKSKTIQGTAMIEAKIDQDTNISSQLTLWSQKGSNVLRGNVLVIPIEDSLLYVEPIYLQADTQNNFPEMKMVVAAYDNKIVMESTLEQALNKVFNINSSNQYVPDSNNKPSQDLDILSIDELITQANENFNKANNAIKNGDWEGYGNYMNKVEEYLNKLNSLTNNQNDNTTNNVDSNVENNTVTDNQ